MTAYPESPIVLVGNEESWPSEFETALKAAGMDHVVRSDAFRVASLLAERAPSVLLLDLKSSGIGGEETLSMIVRDFPQVPVIVVTGSAESEIAVTCVKNGAYDYLAETAGQTELVSVVRRAMEVGALRSEYAGLKTRFFSDRLENPGIFREIVAQNHRMTKIFRYAEAIADSESPVLISGETGVGKELIAKAIHNLSGKCAPFVAVNVAGLSDSVFADTLFGHRKGVFADTDQNRAGLVSKAMGGTLLLDEIGDLSDESQTKLLRLVKETEYFPLGADTPVRSGARVLVSTQLNLEESSQSGRFRKDLFFHLNAHHILVPPLRERMDDLPILVDHFLRQASKNLGKRKPPVPENLMGLLGCYPFPGNVRELQSMVFDAMAGYKSGSLPLDSFRSCIDGNAVTPVPAGNTHQDGMTLFSGFAKLPTIKQASRELVVEAMSRTDGNRNAAAEILGITRQALSWRLKQHR